MYLGFKTYQPTYLWLCTTYLAIKIIYIYSDIQLICHVAKKIIVSRVIISNHH
jgi:hypothetical protein